LNFHNLLKTWKGTAKENRFHRTANLVLALAVGALAILSLQTKTIVTLVPPTLTEEAWVTRDAATEGYRKSWGLYLAELLGNATPGNVQLISDAIGPLLAPSIYQQTILVLRSQSEQILADRISQRFEPRSVLFERETGKVFVEGFSFVQGGAGDEQRTTRTFEFKIDIDRYAPIVTHIDTYADRARTLDMLNRMNRRGSEG